MIDLHLHLDGSIPLSVIPELARIGGISLPDTASDEYRRLFTVEDDCRDLGEYLARFRAPLSLLQHPEQLELATYALCRELDESGMLYAELRFAPQYLVHCGHSQEEMLLAAIRGRERAAKESGRGKDLPDYGFILCCMRGKGNDEANRETIRLAAKYHGRGGVAAADLAGAEALFPASGYASLFQEAREAGVPYTLHAGEADGPQSIREALDIGAQRIGHGIRAYTDEALMKELAKRQIPLECCPVSNMHTNALPEGTAYPLPGLLQRGLKVTVNTDNMTVSGTSLRREYEWLEKNCGMGQADFARMLENSADAAFLEYGEKQQLKKALRKTKFTNNC